MYGESPFFLWKLQNDSFFYDFTKRYLGCYCLSSFQKNIESTHSLKIGEKKSERVQGGIIKMQHLGNTTGSFFFNILNQTFGKGF